MRRVRYSGVATSIDEKSLAKARTSWARRSWGVLQGIGARGWWPRLDRMGALKRLAKRAPGAALLIWFWTSEGIKNVSSCL